MEKRRITRRGYACVNCRYEPSKDDYQLIRKNGELRILLKPVSGTTTLFICPKCGEQHIGPDFQVKLSEHQILMKIREIQKKRVEMLRRLYRR